MTRFLFWLIWHIRVGRLAPWVTGLALGRWPRRVPSRIEGDHRVED